MLIAQHQSLLVSLLKELGFVISYPKSMLEPSHQVEFLGLIVDSQNMALYGPHKKILKVAKECRQLRNKGGASALTWWDCCHHRFGQCFLHHSITKHCRGSNTVLFNQQDLGTQWYLWI